MYTVRYKRTRSPGIAGFATPVANLFNTAYKLRLLRQGYDTALQKLLLEKQKQEDLKEYRNALIKKYEENSPTQRAKKIEEAISNYRATKDPVHLLTTVAYGNVSPNYAFQFIDPNRYRELKEATDPYYQAKTDYYTSAANRNQTQASLFRTNADYYNTLKGFNELKLGVLNNLPEDKQAVALFSSLKKPDWLTQRTRLLEAAIKAAQLELSNLDKNTLLSPELKTMKSRLLSSRIKTYQEELDKLLKLNESSKVSLNREEFLSKMGEVSPELRNLLETAGEEIE